MVAELIGISSTKVVRHTLNGGGMTYLLVKKSYNIILL